MGHIPEQQHSGGWGNHEAAAACRGSKRKHTSSKLARIRVPRLRPVLVCATISGISQGWTIFCTGILENTNASEARGRATSLNLRPDVAQA